MIKDYACCAFSLIWYLGLDPSDVDAIMLVSDLMDSKVSKLYALCKTQQTTETAQIEQQNVQQEHIEDINLDAVLKQ